LSYSLDAAEAEAEVSAWIPDAARLLARSGPGCPPSRNEVRVYDAASWSRPTVPSAGFGQNTEIEPSDVQEGPTSQPGSAHALW